VRECRGKGLVSGLGPGRDRARWGNLEGRSRACQHEKPACAKNRGEGEPRERVRPTGQAIKEGRKRRSEAPSGCASAQAARPKRQR
jgi:hypothetical protein